MTGRRRPPRLTGPATRALAFAAGLTDRQLRHPGVAHLSRDTYLPRALADGAAERLSAVLLTAPPGTVASHRTAAALWKIQIPLQDRGDRRVDVTVPQASRAESRRDRRVYRSDVPDHDVVLVQTYPVTSLARTWRDLAAVLPEGPLLAVTDQVLGRGCTRPALAAQLALRPTGRGCRRARAVLPLGDDRAGSPMESVLRWLLHTAGLPSPVMQHRIADPDGRFLARGDLAWPDAMVLVEFDGDVHRERDVFVDDLRRQNRVVLDGWTILRFNSADLLGRPDDVVAEIRRALHRR